MTNFYQTYVALLCDADKRACHSGAAFVAKMASVHSLHAAYARRLRKNQRALRCMLRHIAAWDGAA